MWVKLDDNFPHHEKLMAVSPEAAALHVGALCYAGRLLTDGRIPRSALPILWPALTKTKHVLEPLASELVEAGLWECFEDGYQIHDFLDYNPSRANAAARRAQKVDSGRKGGRKSGEVRRKRIEARASTNRQARGSSKPQAPGEAPTRPDPTRRGGSEDLRLPSRPDADAPAERAAKTSKKTSKTHPNRQAVIDAFDAIYREATGSPPTWTAKTRGLADTLARTHSVEEIRARFSRCFRDRQPEFLWRDGAMPDLGTVVSQFDRLAKAEPRSMLDGLQPVSIPARRDRSEGIEP